MQGEEISNFLYSLLPLNRRILLVYVYCTSHFRRIDMILLKTIRKTSSFYLWDDPGLLPCALSDMLVGPHRQFFFLI